MPLRPPHGTVVGVSEWLKQEVAGNGARSEQSQRTSARLDNGHSRHFTDSAGRNKFGQQVQPSLFGEDTTEKRLVEIDGILDEWLIVATREQRTRMASGLIALADKVCLVEIDDTGDRPDYVDWISIESEFVARWNDTPGVIRSNWQAIPANLQRQFRDYCRTPGWIDRAYAAMGQFPLKNKVKISLRKFLQATTIDEILGGLHGFDPDRRKRPASETNRDAFEEVFGPGVVNGGNAAASDAGESTDDQNSERLLRLSWNQARSGRTQVLGGEPERFVG